jgi:hypothetical protein
MPPKKSRVIALTIVAFSVMSLVKWLPILAEYTLNFSVPLTIANNMLPIKALYAMVIIVGFYKSCVAAQIFHRALKSRVVVKNIFILALISGGYLVGWGALAGLLMRERYLSEYVTFAEAKVIEPISLILLFVLFFLIIWRKMPGTRNIPAVVWANQKNHFRALA